MRGQQGQLLILSIIRNRECSVRVCSTHHAQVIGCTSVVCKQSYTLWDKRVVDERCGINELYHANQRHVSDNARHISQV